MFTVPSSVGVFQFNTCVAAGEARASTAKLWACRTLEKMSELRVLVGGLNQTLGGERRACARCAVHRSRIGTAPVGHHYGPVRE